MRRVHRNRGRGRGNSEEGLGVDTGRGISATKKGRHGSRAPGTGIELDLARARRARLAELSAERRKLAA